MAAISIKISDPKGEKGPITRVIEAIVEKAADKAGLLASIGKADLHVIQDRFSSKTDPDGAAWTPNAPLTLLLARGGSMMKRSGALVGSITCKVSGNTLEIGPNRVYAAIQQFGGVVKAKTAKGLRIPIPAGTPMTAGQAEAFGVDRKKGNGKGAAGGAARSSEDGAIIVQSVTIPARPYIGIGAKDAEAILGAVEDWFSPE